MEGRIGRRFAMAAETPNSPSPATRSNFATSCNAPNELERLRISEFEPAGIAARSAPDFVAAAPPQRWLAAVEDLLEQAIQRVAAGLEAGTLRNAI
jgi:hypothetical protein